MFAVRAFKSALFGTPNPTQPVSPSNRSRKLSAQNSTQKASAFFPEIPTTSTNVPKDTDDILNQNKLDLDVLVSPTKGILLTPGTITSRRKNVTFRGLGSDEKLKEKNNSRSSLLSDNVPESSLNTSQAAGLIANQSRQTSLAKALYKARDAVPGAKAIRPLSVNRASQKSAPEGEIECPEAIIEKEGCDPGVAADVTIDLNHPHSRSGQHWKAEFEQYHKNSDREMKKIIKVSQNVKSFAVKKDSEASELGEKLQRQLSKVAAMESKVTDLATQLAATKRQDSRETPDQTRLVNDLARQTALAIRYKQKAENYKI